MLITALRFALAQRDTTPLRFACNRCPPLQATLQPFSFAYSLPDGTRTRRQPKSKIRSPFIGQRLGPLGDNHWFILASRKRTSNLKARLNDLVFRAISETQFQLQQLLFHFYGEVHNHS